jgi:hypothetical protein
LIEFLIKVKELRDKYSPKTYLATSTICETKEGKKRWEATTDVQGEFAVHLPAKAAVYLVEVSAPGFQGDRKEVGFTGDERQDLVFRLARKQQ